MNHEKKKKKLKGQTRDYVNKKKEGSEKKIEEK